MKICKYEYNAIYDYLVKERSEGNEYVAFPVDEYSVGMEDLFGFSTQEEALEFCRKSSTDTLSYHYLAIRSAYRVMSEALKDRTLRIVDNGLFDISLMVAARYQ